MSAREEELPPREKKITGGEKSIPAPAGPATNFSGDERREEEQVKAQNAPEPFYQKERRLALVEPPDNDEPPSPYQNKFRLPSFYTQPSLDLLARPSRLGEQQQNKGIRQRARLRESTLESFGVKARVIHVESNPTVTRFEVHPEEGGKVSRRMSLTE